MGTPFPRGKRENVDLGAAQSSIFGSARNFFGCSAGSSRKLRLNSNHAPKVNARPYWAYNRPIMPMYEHFVLPFASWVNNLLCVCNSNVPTETSNETIQQPVIM